MFHHEYGVGGAYSILRVWSAESGGCFLCKNRALRRHYKAQVANICAGGTGDDQVVELFEESVGVAACEILFGVEVFISSARESCLVGDCARSRAVAVDAVSARAQGDDVSVLIIETDGAAQGSFEVSAATPVASDWTGEFTA